MFQFTQRLTALIKGTIAYSKSVSLDLKDFDELSGQGVVKPVRMDIQFCSMNAPTFVSTVQWDGESANSFTRVKNYLIQKTRVHKISFYWPNEAFLYTSPTSTQTLVQIYHNPAGDVYEEDKPLVFYMAKLTVVRADDMMSSSVDPPHFNISIKNSAPAPSVSEASMSPYAMMNDCLEDY